MTKVINLMDQEVDFDAAVALMDDDLREEIICKSGNMGIDISTPQNFFEVYAVNHLAQFGDDFEPWVGGAW